MHNSLATVVLVFAFVHARTTDARRCGYKPEKKNFFCEGIKGFPKLKEINNSTIRVIISKSILNKTDLENIELPANVTHLIIDNSSIPGIENMSLPACLRELEIGNCKIKKVGGILEGISLKVLNLHNNKIEGIEEGAFDNLRNLVFLSLQSNELKSFPVFKICHPKLNKINLDDNSIKELKRKDLSYFPSLQEFFMRRNELTTLKNIFPPASQITELRLSGNPIREIDSDAFENLRTLKLLFLDNTFIENLPTRGLQQLTNLSLKGVERLRTIPEGLKKVENVRLAKDKSFLCCKVKYDKIKGQQGPTTFPTQVPKPCARISSTSLPSTVPSPGRNQSTQPSVDRIVPPLPVPQSNATPNPISDPQPVNCTPEPTAFQPCENIMGADWLTAISFVVGPFALCGNFVVIVVFLCLARNYNVSRFLVTNLAIADMCMGIYVLSLVIESVNTAGEYYLHVERFQHGFSCKVLGFLAMFSSELSVFSLTLITVERYLTVVYAMYPRRRLSMGHAFSLMVLGWAVAITIAILPVFGVGSYGKVAICLPFDTKNGGDIYLFFVFTINGLSFLFISALYCKIYRSVFLDGNSTPTRGHDMRVARRMAILVFTDFACFAPIAVTGLSALLGHELIGVRESKYLLVFFYPLNGLLNPFLYAIITKGFRRDFAKLLKNCFVCGDTFTQYLSSYPARSMHSTNDVFSRSARPSLDFNALDFHTRSLGNVRGSRENPISASFSKSEPNLVKFTHEVS